MASLLVVDDDSDVIETICAVLRSAGHKVEQASGGLAALDILDQAPIDLLITDVVMHGLNGFNLARMAVLRQPELKVLYYSGFSEYTIDADTGLKYGKLLHKPLRPHDLRREVNEALA